MRERYRKGRDKEREKETGRQREKEDLTHERKMREEA